jgi:hypothetical protein
LRIARYLSLDSRQHQNIIAHGNHLLLWVIFLPPPSFPGLRYPVMQVHRPRATMHDTRLRSKVAVLFCSTKSHIVNNYLRKSFLTSGTLPGRIYEPHCFFLTKCYDEDRAPQNNVCSAVFLSKLIKQYRFSVQRPSSLPSRRRRLRWPAPPAGAAAGALPRGVCRRQLQAPEGAVAGAGAARRGGPSAAGAAPS